MTIAAPSTRVQLFDLNPQPVDQRAELLAGLHQRPRRIAPKFFYDERGSQLFDEITRQPEYYPTRTERAILEAAAGKIRSRVGADCVLIEPGSGSCEKVELLLPALAPRAYVPTDISAEHLGDAARRLAQRWPHLPIFAVCADYSAELELPPTLPRGRRVAFFPGSTLGNFEPTDARRFLRGLRRLVGDDGGLLLGVDQIKDQGVLEAAYNDAAGITAAFNRNVLNHANRILGADFESEHFAHRAFFNTTHSRIEMHLISTRDQLVRTDATTLAFTAGESIHTENSYKYSAAGLERLAAQAGFTTRERWSDTREWFALYYLEAI